MYRDITLVNVGNCAQIFDDKTLITYTSQGRIVYKLISDKYYPIESFAPVQPATEVTCYSQTQIATLPSNYDFMSPIFQSLAIGSAVIIFYFAYKLFLYPWFRRRT